MSEELQLTEDWYRKFNRYASDLYPGRYTYEKCFELARTAINIRLLAEVH